MIRGRRRLTTGSGRRFMRSSDWLTEGGEVSINDDDPFLRFLERLSALLEKAASQFAARDNAAAVQTMERVVRLCESHPSFALRRGEKFGNMREVVETCIRHASHRRAGVHRSLAALLKRIEAMAQTGLQ